MAIEKNEKIVKYENDLRKLFRAICKESRGHDQHLDILRDVISNITIATRDGNYKILEEINKKYFPDPVQDCTDCD